MSASLFKSSAFRLSNLALTCWYDVEHTGLVGPLIADHVGSPAEEGPEVHVRVRGVADHAEPLAGAEARGGQEGGGEGVVEPVELGPGEGVGVLLHEAQVDGGGETGLPGEMRGWQSQTDQREEKYHGDSVRCQAKCL